MKRLIVMIVGAVLAGTLLAPAGGAEAQSSPVRVQLLIHKIKVLDDSDDLGWGELTYRLRFQRGSASCPGFWCTGPADEFRLTESRKATTNQIIGLEKVLGGDQGLALLPGDAVRVGMAGVEEDWDGLGLAFCPPGLGAQFDDSLCGAHDQLGVDHRSWNASQNFGIGEHSHEVWKGGDATFRVDFQIRPAPGTVAATGAGLVAAPTPRPSPTPRATPRSRPPSPRQYEP